MAQRFKTSATNPDLARRILNIPTDVAKLTIYDFGSGACPLVARLLKNGNAFGVDCLYFRDKKEIVLEIEVSLRRIIERVPEGFKVWMESRTRDFIAEFLESFSGDRPHYIASYLTRIDSIGNGVSDLTVSLNALSYLVSDLEVFFAAFEKAIDITKPGKEVVMAPWHTREDEQYFKEHSRICAEIKAMNIGQVEVDREIPGLPEYHSGRIRVLKRNKR